MIELSLTVETFLLGEVVKTRFTYSGETREEYMGSIKTGDEVVMVRRWVPAYTGGGSNIYTRAEGEVPIHCFCEDVRMRLKKCDLEGPGSGYISFAKGSLFRSWECFFNGGSCETHSWSSDKECHSGRNYVVDYCRYTCIMHTVNPREGTATLYWYNIINTCNTCVCIILQCKFSCM